MKIRRLLTGILAVSLTVSMCGCTTHSSDETKETPDVTSSETMPTESSTEVTTSTSEEPTTPTTVSTSIADESDDPIVIYGYDQELPQLIDQYLPDQEYEYVYVKPEEYYNKLQTALNSEEKAPDLFMMDKDHLATWVNGGQTLSMDQLGISKEDLADQFSYTYQVATNSERAIYALSYDLSPSCVFYNRALTLKTLGTAEPSEVDPYISNWEMFLDTARTVNMDSQGAIKLVASRDEIRPVFWAAHTEEWVQDGQVKVGNELTQYFMLQEALFAETLTGDKDWGSQEWKKDLMSDQAVMFFGSLDTATDVIGYVPGHTEPEETEATDPNAEDTTETSETIQEETGWSILPQVNPTYDGGIWLMVAASTDKKASAATILRALTMDENTMTDMALQGRFVNSVTIMKQCAADPSFASDFLNGQNPYVILVESALNIYVPSNIEVNNCVETEIDTLLEAYLGDELMTMDEVKEQFVVGLEELLGLV